MSCEVATSYSLRRSVLTASQKLRQRQSPLKSVENQIKLGNKEKMNDQTNITILDQTTVGITIKQEPFTDFYSVEEQVGR